MEKVTIDGLYDATDIPFKDALISRQYIMKDT